MPRINKLLCLLPVLCSFSCSNVNIITKSVYAYGTTWRIELYDGNNVDADNIEDILLTSSKIFDDEQSHFSNGDLFALNNASSPIVIEDDLFKILTLSEAMKTTSQGYFNVLSKGLAKLYKDQIESSSPTLPSQKDVSDEVSKTSASSLSLTALTKTASILGEAKIDLGAVGKGYALDLIYGYIKDKGLKSYMINGGSSSLLLGKSKEGGDFSLYLEDDASFSKKVSNCFVGVSSVSKQSVKVGDTLLSHIVNPLTGSGTPKRQAAVSFFDVSKDNGGFYSDAISTVLMNAPDNLISSLSVTLGFTYHLVDYLK